MKNCKICGCWDRQACPGGCHWILEDMCSQCTGNRKPTIDDLQKRGFKNKDYVMLLDTPKGLLMYYRRTFSFVLPTSEHKKMTLLELDKYLSNF